MKNKLIEFLYVLMRDELPTGKVCTIISQLSDCDEIIFTNEHLQALATDYANRICDANE